MDKQRRYLIKPYESPAGSLSDILKILGFINIPAVVFGLYKWDLEAYMLAYIFLGGICLAFVVGHFVLSFALHMFCFVTGNRRLLYDYDSEDIEDRKHKAAEESRKHRAQMSKEILEEMGVEDVK